MHRGRFFELPLGCAALLFCVILLSTALAAPPSGQIAEIRFPLARPAGYRQSQFARPGRIARVVGAGPDSSRVRAEAARRPPRSGNCGPRGELHRPRRVQSASTRGALRRPADQTSRDSSGKSLNSELRRAHCPARPSLLHFDPPSAPLYNGVVIP